MAKNYMQWKTKGMNRDTSASAFNSEFAFENVNLRLATNEGNTMMSWVNERGTKEIVITSITQAWDGKEVSKVDGVSRMVGTAIGTAIINHQLVVFTTTAEEAYPDRIYVLSYSDKAQTEMTAKLLFQGHLNFNVKYPLETMVAFEASYVQKVYWTDNYNQPRLINIAASQDKCAKWNAKPEELSYYFDFVPSFTMKESDVSITMNISAGGLFAPGVIQYVCTYINKYGQESNIAYISTLYYLTFNDRAASPEEKVTSSFSIKIQNADTNFDYVRIYSIQRTSLDATALVKKLDDFPITEGEDITYTDTGMYGSTVDPTELLYVGGKEIKALTMTSKDNTLFMGNITQKNFLVKSIQKMYDGLRDKEGFKIEFRSETKGLTIDKIQGTYSHTQTLKHNHREISTFKGGEVYRLGFQLQKKTGEWSEPIFLLDYLNELYPNTYISKKGIGLSFIIMDDLDLDAMAEVYNEATGNDFFEVFTAVRPAIVYPTIGDRNILCQGVLNPTVFNSEDRGDNSPFAQPSWFFRPYCFETNSFTNVDDEGGTSLTPTVVIEDKPSNADELIEASKSPLLGYSNFYIMIADIDEDTAAGIVSKGYLKYKWASGSWSAQDDNNQPPDFSIGYQTYWGHIKLSTDGTTHKVRYAFLYSLKFMEEKDIDTSVWDDDKECWVYTIDKLQYIDIEVLSNDGVAFPVYPYLKRTNNYYLYYSPAYGKEGDTYTLMFYANFVYIVEGERVEENKLYTVTFSYVASDSSTVVSATSGNSLQCTHYSPISSVSHILSSITQESAKNIEIEGSSATYTIPYTRVDSTSSKSRTNNKEYFVDQSIVTLNSPDVEFDTDVQTYGFEGLHLRILGIIPITGYRSAHSISTSGVKMDLYHGTEDGGKYYGAGELSDNITHENTSSRAGKRLISDYLWNEVYVVANADSADGISSSSVRANYLVYPWQRTGSLSNDVRDKENAVSYLEHKKISHVLYSSNSLYFIQHQVVGSIEIKNTPLEISNLNTALHLTENEEVYNIKIPAQYEGATEINYYPNIDKVLYNTEGYYIYCYKQWQEWDEFMNKDTMTSAPVSMKYKSTTHIAIAMKPETDDRSNKVPILPYAWSVNPVVHTDDSTWETPGKYTDVGADYSHHTFWGDIMEFTQEGYNLNNLFQEVEDNLDFLWLGELYKDVDDSARFGGTTELALRANQWLIGGESVPIVKNAYGSKNIVSLSWTEGDTYYQRYDCLKTYPFTTEDINQNTEILSFMCETHVNLDGRYDQNRNQTKSYLMRPDNYNLMNPVYSQKNNFFTSTKVDTEDVEELEYPNYITYSKTKQSGADVDEWTNVTLASVLEMDGDKGQVTSLNRLNDQLIAFQDKGISQILYNENVQISSTEGVPIEIANSGKVQGKRYLSDTIGCSNKWSVLQTPKGIYFMDSNDKSIYLFNGQLNNLSQSGGFNTWAKQNIPVADEEHKWDPVDYKNFRTFYDKLNQDVLFIDDSQALAFSERFGNFTSFYAYEKAPYFENLDDSGIWLKDGKLWKHNAGEYCNFFGANKPYSMTLVANANPQVDKMFTNLELRACMNPEGAETTTKYNNKTFVPNLPFDSIEAWDEYQHGKLNLSNKGHMDSTTKHGTDSSQLLRKFRMWRCDIPRDNVPVTAEEKLYGILRTKAHPLDRIRNPWAYIKLYKDAASGSNTLPKAEIHDIMVTYFG